MGLSISYVQNPQQSKTINVTVSGNDISFASTITWGDGTPNTVLSAGVTNASHTYSGVGPYTLRVTNNTSTASTSVHLSNKIVSTVVPNNPRAIITTLYNYNNNNQYTWNWGDGTSPYTLAIGGATAGSQPGALHGFPNNYKPYDVSVISGGLNLKNKVLLPSQINLWFDNATNPTICYYDISSPYLSTAYQVSGGPFLQASFGFPSLGDYVGTRVDQVTTAGHVSGNFPVRLDAVRNGFAGNIFVYRSNSNFSNPYARFAITGSNGSVGIPTPYPTSWVSPFVILF